MPPSPPFIMGIQLSLVHQQSTIERLPASAGLPSAAGLYRSGSIGGARLSGVAGSSRLLMDLMSDGRRTPTSTSNSHLPSRGMGNMRIGSGSDIGSGSGLGSGSNGSGMATAGVAGGIALGLGHSQLAAHGSRPSGDDGAIADGAGPCAYGADTTSVELAVDMSAMAIAASDADLAALQRKPRPPKPRKVKKGGKKKVVRRAKAASGVGTSSQSAGSVTTTIPAAVAPTAPAASTDNKVVHEKVSSRVSLDCDDHTPGIIPPPDTTVVDDADKSALPVFGIVTHGVPLSGASKRRSSKKKPKTPHATVTVEAAKDLPQQQALLPQDSAISLASNVSHTPHTMPTRLSQTSVTVTEVAPLVSGRTVVIQHATSQEAINDDAEASLDIDMSHGHATHKATPPAAAKQHQPPVSPDRRAASGALAGPPDISIHPQPAVASASSTNRLQPLTHVPQIESAHHHPRPPIQPRATSPPVQLRRRPKSSTHGAIQHPPPQTKWASTPVIPQIPPARRRKDSSPSRSNVYTRLSASVYPPHASSRREPAIIPPTPDLRSALEMGSWFEKMKPLASIKNQLDLRKRLQEHVDYLYRHRQNQVAAEAREQSKSVKEAQWREFAGKRARVLALNAVMQGVAEVGWRRRRAAADGVYVAATAATPVVHASASDGDGDGGGGVHATLDKDADVLSGPLYNHRQASFGQYANVLYPAYVENGV
ncbi:hypothetical protein BC831DRAFT_508621 [Entophlyctis helioformis]|nr:hypothetical protein BC831DRAFT_508621 [Entophlyctis helioformis]